MGCRKRHDLVAFSLGMDRILISFTFSGSYVRGLEAKCVNAEYFSLKNRKEIHGHLFSACWQQWSSGFVVTVGNPKPRHKQTKSAAGDAFPTMAARGSSNMIEDDEFELRLATYTEPTRIKLSDFSEDRLGRESIDRPKPDDIKSQPWPDEESPVKSKPSETQLLADFLRNTGPDPMAAPPKKKKRNTGFFGWRKKKEKEVPKKPVVQEQRRPTPTFTRSDSLVAANLKRQEPREVPMVAPPVSKPPPPVIDPKPLPDTYPLETQSPQFPLVPQAFPPRNSDMEDDRESWESDTYDYMTEELARNTEFNASFTALDVDIDYAALNKPRESETKVSFAPMVEQVSFDEYSSGSEMNSLDRNKPGLLPEIPNTSAIDLQFLPTQFEPEQKKPEIKSRGSSLGYHGKNEDKPLPDTKSFLDQDLKVQQMTPPQTPPRDADRKPSALDDQILQAQAELELPEHPEESDLTDSSQPYSNQQYESTPSYSNQQSSHYSNQEYDEQYDSSQSYGEPYGQSKQQYSDQQYGQPKKQYSDQQYGQSNQQYSDQQYGQSEQRYSDEQYSEPNGQSRQYSNQHRESQEYDQELYGKDIPIYSDQEMSDGLYSMENSQLPRSESAASAPNRWNLDASPLQTEFLEPAEKKKKKVRHVMIQVGKFKTEPDAALLARIAQLEQHVAALTTENENLIHELQDSQMTINQSEAMKQQVLETMEEQKKKFDKLSASAYKKIKELLTDRQIMDIEVKSLKYQVDCC